MGDGVVRGAGGGRAEGGVREREKKFSCFALTFEMREGSC